MSCASRSELPSKADTTTEMFLSVAKVSSLWSPNADSALAIVVTVSRISTPLAAQVVGGGVDELAERTHPARLCRLQRIGELLQLFTQIIPLQRNSGALLRNDRTIGQLRPVE